MISARIRARQNLGSIVWQAGRRTAADGTLTVLMYHAVTRDPIDDAGQMGVSAGRFARQMTEIRESGTRVVDLAEGVAALRRSGPDGPAVSIVFDDGFVGVHDFAAEILERHSFRATVFVSTSWIGKNLMPVAERRLGRPLTWTEVQALDRAGMRIGSHTHTHPRLSSLNEEGIRREVRQSRDAIAERIGRAPKTFAYPFGSFGSFDSRTRAVLDEEGFHVACTAVAGRNTCSTDPLALRRIRVSWCDGDGEIRKAIAGCYDWYRWVQRVQSMRAPAAS